MQRSKQQALMFLLGAVLVGGVLGFSAERVLGHDRDQHSWAARTRFYDDLALSAGQRAAMDSVLDHKNRQIDSVMQPIRPHLDSIRSSARQQYQKIMTPQQWANFRARVREDSLRRVQQQTLNSKDQKQK